MKKILMLLIVTLISLGLAAAGFAAGATYNGYQIVKVTVNGNPIESDVPAIIMDGRTLLPVRAVADALGMEVGYDETTSTVTLMSQEKIVDATTTQRIIPEEYYVKSEIITTSDKNKQGLVFMDDEPYMTIGTFAKYSTWDGTIATIAVPGYIPVIIGRDQPYELGIDGFMLNGRTYVRLSAVGLNPVINGDSVILEAID